MRLMTSDGHRKIGNGSDMASMLWVVGLAWWVGGELRQRGGGGIEIADKVKVDEIVRGDAEDGAWPVVHASNGRRWRARLLVCCYSLLSA